MQNKMNAKKLISSLLALVLVLSTMAIGMFAYGDEQDGVRIDANHFPDENFRTIVSLGYDTDGDGYLSESETASKVMLAISGMLEAYCGEDATISDLTGIEYFTSTKRLRCGGIGLTALDVSKMPQLVELTCPGNHLTALDLSNNGNLEWINCAENELETLDLSPVTSLTKLECYSNPLGSLDVSVLPALETLRCHDCELTALNLSSNTALKTLSCSHNYLTALDLSKNKALQTLTNTAYGDQTAASSAYIGTSYTFVDLAVSNYRNIVSTSIDSYNSEGRRVLAYNVNRFYTQNTEDIKDGIDYLYDVGLSAAEYMDVPVDVARDFYFVSFYSSEDKTERFALCLVNNGEAATAPTEFEVPQCKAFDAWSGDFSEVTEDLEIYAIWKDHHTLEITDFQKGIVSVDCSVCEDQKATYKFADYINIRQNEESFAPILDRNADGIINAKDYAKLKKQF